MPRWSIAKILRAAARCSPRWPTTRPAGGSRSTACHRPTWRKRLNDNETLRRMLLIKLAALARKRYCREHAGFPCRAAGGAAPSLSRQIHRLARRAAGAGCTGGCERQRRERPHRRAVRATLTATGSSDVARSEDMRESRPLERKEPLRRKSETHARRGFASNDRSQQDDRASARQFADASHHDLKPAPRRPTR